MKLGCCLLSTSCLPEVTESAYKKADQLLLGYKIMKEAGYKYMECGVGMLMDLTEEELDLLVETSKKGQFQLEASNCFIPLPCTRSRRARSNLSRQNGGAYVREFAKHLCASTYNGRVSVECLMDDLEKECTLAYA